MKKILGIIPARSGSKGVPGKNIKVLGNKPLLNYTAEAALDSKLLTRVILSTDTEEIAAIGLRAGVDVPFLRPASLAADTTPTLPVIQYCLQKLSESGEEYDAVCILQTTYPFRAKGFIDLCIERFIEKDADSLVSVLPVPNDFNPHWIFESNKDNYLHISTGETEIIKRRQDLPIGYYRDGNIYLTKSEIILNKNSLYGTKIAFLESDPKLYVNIDTPGDWADAEKKLEELGM